MFNCKPCLIIKFTACAILSLSLLFYFIPTDISVSAKVDIKSETGQELYQNDETSITFPDPNLESVIREALGKPAGALAVVDLRKIVNLDGYDRGITDLTNSDYLINITYLDMRENNITDISPFASLTKLETLYLKGNQIRDISPLAGLTSLVDLTLRQNQISDISALVRLTNLNKLYLYENQITDFSPLLQNPGLGAGDIIELQDINFNLKKGTSLYDIVAVLEERGSSVIPATKTKSDDSFWKIVWSIFGIVVVLGLTLRVFRGAFKGNEIVMCENGHKMSKRKFDELGECPACGTDLRHKIE